MKYNPNESGSVDFILSGWWDEDKKMELKNSRLGQKRCPRGGDSRTGT